MLLQPFASETLGPDDLVGSHSCSYLVTPYYRSLLSTGRGERTLFVVN